MIGDAPRPYGAYGLAPLRGLLLRCAQRQPVSWFGRRVALLLRRLVLSERRGSPLDAQAEGFRLRVHTADNVSVRKFLFMPQFVDPFERSYIAAQLRRGDVFLGVGANAGIYTLTAARALQQAGSGRVISIEPNPIMYERLMFNVGLNGYEDVVETVPVALSDAPGRIAFTIARDNLGESSMVAAVGRGIEVPAKTLLGLLTEKEIRAAGGLKIDVEGAEDRILVPFFTDAPRALLPRFVIIENPKGLWREDLLGLMLSKVYRLLRKQRMNSVYVLDEPS